MADREVTGGWTFLSNHTHVLLCIRNDPDVRLRDIAEQVGITERAAQNIVRDLVDAGYLQRTRVGRRNRYHVTATRPLRHSLERHHPIDALLEALAEPPAPRGQRRTD